MMGLFGSSGYRRIVSRDFFETTFRIGLAVGKVKPSVLVGRDTRTSSEAAAHVAIAGLLASGCRVHDAGVVPTPTLAYACRAFDAGLMITASHNPPSYNGIKLWNRDRSAFGVQQRQEIEDLVAGANLETAPWECMATRAFQFTGAIEDHLAGISRDFPEKLGLKVVLDCGCGAGSLATPHLLQQLGCQVIALNSHPSGFFPRGIEPTQDNLRELLAAVVSYGADIGLAHDADADRLAIVDERGKLAPGDKVMVLFARELKARTVVTTVDASMSADEQGFTTVRTKVGDAYVSEQLSRAGDLGAEPAGAYIFPGLSLCPDGIYAAALAVRVAGHGKLSTQLESVPEYCVKRGSVAAKASLMAQIEAELALLPAASISRVDGIRLHFADGWLLVRSSGTEPRIRVTAEAKTQARTEELYQAAISAIARTNSDEKGLG